MQEEEVQEDDSDHEDTVQCPVSNSDAARMFEQCLSWLEHQPEASVLYLDITHSGCSQKNTEICQTN